jgi:hypothetical protein
MPKGIVRRVGRAAQKTYEQRMREKNPPRVSTKTKTQTAPAGADAYTPVRTKIDKPVKTVKTKGGDYHVYKKGSGTAKSFRQAFREARKAGKSTFTWQGRKYTTALKKTSKKKATKK